MFGPVSSMTGGQWTSLLLPAAPFLLVLASLTVLGTKVSTLSQRHGWRISTSSRYGSGARRSSGRHAGAGQSALAAASDWRQSRVAMHSSTPTHDACAVQNSSTISVLRVFS